MGLGMGVKLDRFITLGDLEPLPLPKRAVSANNKVLVTGAGGFIGGHLMKVLIDSGKFVVYGVDVKPLELWWQKHDNAINLDGWDLRNRDEALKVFNMVRPGRVFALAADMGGMGFIQDNDSVLRDNMRINANTIEAAINAGVERYLFTSSVCVYSGVDEGAMLEESAYPANPDSDYGWEKLVSERMLQAAATGSNMQVRIARLHNTYGPHGTWYGGREKAPAALCRKIIESENMRMLDDSPLSIDVWGDGNATRIFMYIDDCVEGLIYLMDSDYPYPINIGPEEQVTINALVFMVSIVHYKACSLQPYVPMAQRLHVRYVDGPVGHAHRKQDNTLLREVLDWEPTTKLQDGLEILYKWIEEQRRNTISLGVV